jgi:hypothetical protein
LGYGLAVNQQQPPRDPAGYRIAVGAVGLSLVVFVFCAGWIVSTGNSAPPEFWPFGSGLAGALFGILGTPATTTETDEAGTSVTTTKTVAVGGVSLPPATAALLVVFLASIAIAIIASNGNPSTEVLSLVTTSGGALLGLLAPSPAGAHDTGPGG